MKTARIEDIAEFVLDGTHGSPIRTETGIPVLSAQNVKNGELSFETDRYTSVKEYEAFQKRLPLKVGDVLLTIVGTIGRAAVLTEAQPLVFQRSVAVIRPKIEVVISRFFFHVTKTQEFQAQLLRSSNQSSQAGVYLGKLKEIRVPVPSLTEQRRIADILDHADELRAKRRAALAQLDTLTQSIFVDLFGDPVTNPKGWPRRIIGEIGSVVTGNTPPRSNPGYYGTSIEWIKSDNINTPHYFLTKADEGLSDAGKAVARIVPPHSILVTCIAGSPDCIGNAAIADREVAFNQQINAIVPSQSNVYFLYAQLLVGKKLIQHASTAGMKGMVSKSRFEQVSLMLPPADLQCQFSQRFTLIEKIKAIHRASLAELDALFASLQHRAFQGEL